LNYAKKSAYIQAYQQMGYTMNLKLKLIFLSLLLLAQPAESSRPLSELITFGVTRVAVGSAQVVASGRTLPTKPVCQMFHLETLLTNSENLTVLDVNTTMISRMVPLLLSLKEGHSDKPSWKSPPSILSTQDFQDAKRYEEEISKDFFQASHERFKFTSLSKVSGDSKIVVPLQICPGNLSIDYLKKILDLHKLDNIIFLHLNDDVRGTEPTSKSSYIPTGHWKEDLPWAKRQPSPHGVADGSNMIIYNQGTKLFDGTLTHGNMIVPGKQVLARLIIEMTRSNGKSIDMPSLSHYVVGNNGMPVLYKDQSPANYRYHSSFFDVGEEKGVVYEGPNYWHVRATNDIAYDFPNKKNNRQ
jgi:hypothetical protein